MATPTNPKGIYYEASTGLTDPGINLVNLDTGQNLLFIFQGVNTATPGGVSFTKSSRYATQAALNAEVVTCRARGQLVIVTCGGAGEQIDITNITKANQFVADVKAINVQFGGSGTTKAIDGIDFNNFEQASDPNLGIWMGYAAQQLKNYYGSDFYVGAPPAASHFNGQAARDRALLLTMYETLDNNGNHCLDLFFPQFYDGPGLNTQGQIDEILGYYFNGLDSSHFVELTEIPRNRIGIGFGIVGTGFHGADASNWWTAANAAAAYTDAVNDGNQPKGAMNFSVSNDQGQSFATTVTPVINNNEAETDGLIEYAFTASSFATTTTTTGVSGSNVTDGSVSSPTTAGNNGYASDPVISISPASGATTAGTAVSTNSYIQFTLTPNAGKRVSLATLTFNAARGGAATPRGYDVRSSLDGYATTLGTADLSTQRVTFTPVSISLSGANFQNQTSAITFRIYVYAPSTANVIDIDSISVNGAVLDVPSGIPQLIIC